MIKSELVHKIAAKLPNISVKKINEGVNLLVETMANTLQVGGRIEVRGFGGFSVRNQKERIAHNPKTNEKIIAKPKRTIHFKPGKELRERVNASNNIKIEELK